MRCDVRCQRCLQGDELRVRYNLRSYGYISVLGSGLTVVDLNRFYRTPFSGPSTQEQSSLRFRIETE